MPISFIARILPLVAALVVSGCGYTPPGGTNTQSTAYRADLEACDASVPDAVDKRNAKTGLAWFGGPATRWGQIDVAMNACMGAKGWGQIRACTADELRTGAPTRVVTRQGVRCADPAKPPTQGAGKS